MTGIVAVGCHVSIAGSLARAVDRALERGCDVFQIFTSNPRGWAAKDLSPDDAGGFRDGVRKAGLAAVAHMPYLPNLASPKPAVYARSVDVMIREMERCSALRISHLITHLGSHLGDGETGGRQRLADGIARALAGGPQDVRILLENTAGTKNSMGGTFPGIRDVMDAVDAPGRLGICLDTCHAYAAGYDLASPEAVAATLDAFDSAIGFQHLFCVHCNDSKGPLGGALDRHEHIGLGTIGDAGFAALLARPEIRRLPLICETPVDARRTDADNIRHIRLLAGPERSTKKGEQGF